MDELDFFGVAGPRSAEERERRIARFVPDSEAVRDFMEYGYNYFDNPDYGVGYGGYRYDGRYAASVERMIAHYRLAPGARVLELGCAKGFILYEFLKRGMRVAGIDLSDYAVRNAVPEVRPHIVHGSCERLPWDTGSFDFVYSKETLPHLTESQVTMAVREALRVCGTDAIFLEIQVGEDERAHRLMQAWDGTHQCLRSADWWRSALERLNFRGAAHFKTLF